MVEDIWGEKNNNIAKKDYMSCCCCCRCCCCYLVSIHYIFIHRRNFPLLAPSPYHHFSTRIYFMALKQNTIHCYALLMDIDRFAEWCCDTLCGRVTEMTTLVWCVLVKFVKKVGVFGRWHFHESNKEKTMMEKRENKLGWKFLFFLLIFSFFWGKSSIGMRCFV